MARHWKIAIAVLGVLALVGLVSFPSLLRNVLRLRRERDRAASAPRD